MTRIKWLILLFLCGVSAAWCYFEIAALMDTRGGSVGFHPLVLLAIPVGCAFSLFMLVAVTRGNYTRAGLLSVLPILALGLPLLFAYDLGIAGWSQEIARHSDTNLAAINNVDFSIAQFDDVPYKDHERMVAVPGFKWSNSQDMIAAKNGVFHGFAVDGVPHVYICPLMNGARGLAWVTDSAMVNKNSDVRYEFTGVASWYIWTMSAR